MYSHTHVQQQLKRFFLNKNAEAVQLIEKIRERETQQLCHVSQPGQEISWMEKGAPITPARAILM